MSLRAIFLIYKNQCRFYKSRSGVSVSENLTTALRPIKSKVSRENQVFVSYNIMDIKITLCRIFCR